MSNYSKTTDFAAKDSLPTGDSGKIIRGSEFETEFDAISTAIATKADTAGPTFTGTLTFETISDGTINVTAFVDEDNMASNSATLVPTQQSVKAYVDSQLTAQDLDFQADSGGALSIDLDSETMTFTGGTGIDTSGSGNAVTFAIDSTVATLTGTQTLTNKTLTSPDVNTPDIDGGTIDGTTIGGTTPAAGNFTTGSFTGNVSFGDNDKAVFGAGSDLEIYHDGTNSRIDDTGTGNLIIRAADQLYLGKYTGETYLQGSADGPVRLFHNGVEKLETTSTGIDVTGVITTDGMTTSADINFGDNDKAIFGAGSDLQIFHDGSHSFISDQGTGHLKLLVRDFRINDNSDTAQIMKTVADGQVELFYNGGKKFETTSTGVDVDGTVTANDVDLAQKAVIGGNTPRIELFESDTTNLNTRIRNTAGELQIQSTDDAGTTSKTRIVVDHATGDISFREDTGATAKLFFDASAERLGIGNSGPSTALHITSTDSIIKLDGTSSARVQFMESDTTDKNFDLTLNNGTFLLNEVTDSGSFVSTPFKIEGGAGSNALVVDSSGNVGIGTSSPATTLTVEGSSANGIELNRNGADATSSARLFFDSSTNCSAIFNSGGNLVFATGATPGSASGVERVRIDSSGNLLVSGTEPNPAQNNTTDAISLHNVGLLRASTTNAAAPLDLNVKSRDGDIAQLRKDGTLIGNIGVNSSNAYFASSEFGIKPTSVGLVSTNTSGVAQDGAEDLGGSSFRWRDLYLSGSLKGNNITTTGSAITFINSTDALHFGGSEFRPFSADDNVINLGASANRWKDLYLSGGAYLGGTATANKLDDYEEGTFTPVVEGSTTAGTGTYVTQNGTYTKIGNTVSANISLNMSAHTGSGTIRIPLPFTSTGEAVGVVMDQNFNYSANASLVAFTQSQSFIQLYAVGDNAPWAAQTLAHDSAFTLFISITYRTTA